jgi:DNA-binding SARP family transcriptional activator
MVRRTMAPTRADPNDLQIRLLGELEVIAGGRRLSLPQSKKTRALLGYFALNSRSHRRERLASLLWDVADDPRGALRWSLSKLRELVDGPDRPRLIANREHVSLELQTAWVDVFEAKRLLAGPTERASDADLEAARALFRGELLEGLEFPDFQAFDAWCLAERQTFRELHRRVVTTLLARAARPERAVSLVRELVQLDPTDAGARSQLHELLQATGQSREAEAQARANRRLTVDSVPLPPPPQAAPDVRTRRSLPPDNPQLPFVGRALERERLREWLDGARGKLRILLIEGEAGIGKSRLLRELARSATASGWRVDGAGVPEARPGWPYAPFRALLPQLLTGDLEPAIRADLAPLLPEPGERSESTSDRDAMFRAVQACFERAAQSAPLLVSFDDAHWLDPASAELLHFLALGARARPIALVLAARSGELRDQPGLLRSLRALRREGLLEEMSLAPLTREETRELVGSLVAEADRAELYERCSGNPLYALELAREPASITDGLPGSISRLVRERLDALPSEQAELLRWAAVLGASFELEPLAQLVGGAPESFVDALEGLDSRGWVEAPRGAGRSAAFSHALVQRAIYDQLSEPRRRLMHGKIARALAARGDATERAAEIAHHGVLGGDPAMAAHACLSAGRRCVRMFAPSDAVSLSRRGLVYAEQLAEPERTTLSIDLLGLQFDARRPDSNDDVLPKLVELSARALDLGAIEHARRGFFLRARLTWERGQVADTRRFSHEVERISRLADPRERATALADAARCLVVVERDLTEAEAFVLEAEEAVALEPESRPSVLPLARGVLSLHRGELERAHDSLVLARHSALRDGDRIVEFLALENLVDLELIRGNLRVAQPLAEELVALGDRVRSGSEAPFARAMLALVRYTAGATEGPAELDQALEALRLEDAKQRYSHLLARAADVERSRGAWPTAVAHAQEALRLAELMERHSEAAIALSVLVAADAASGARPTPQREAALRKLLEQPLAADARRCAERAVAPRPESKDKPHGTRHRRTNLR